MKNSDKFLSLALAIMLITACGDGNTTEDTTPPTISEVSATKTTLQLPDETSVTLNGTATSADGSAVKSYTWELAQGSAALPNSAEIENTSNLSATVTGLDVAGTYKFQLKVTGNNDMEKTSGVVTVTVNADMREPNVTNVKSEPASIAVPAETSVQLSCTASSADGSAAKSVVWSLESTPTGATPSVNSETGAVSNMTVVGEYKFKVTVTGNNDVPTTEEVIVNVSLGYEVEFVELVAGNTIDFSPSTVLPVGVTYILTDDKDNGDTETSPWNSAEGFNGEVTAAGLYTTNGSVIFTQIFYLNGVEILGSTRTVTVTVGGLSTKVFSTINGDTGSATLQEARE
jgi:uncharacterized lipoprotein YajG